MRKGIIKVNPWRFCPVVAWKNGKVEWGGTKRERPATESFEITPSQQAWAMDHINEEMEFYFDDKDYARFII